VSRPSLPVSRRVARPALAAIAGLAAALAVATPAHAAGTAPKKYSDTLGPAKMVAGGSLASTTIGCPTGTVLWGGGSTFLGSGFSTAAVVAGSSPFDNSGSGGWIAKVENPSSTTLDYRASVVCAAKPSGYKIKISTFPDPAGAVLSDNVTCPAKTVLLSGGGFSVANALGVFLTGLWPRTSTTFSVGIANTTGSASTFRVVAVCGKKPAGYKIVTTKGTADPGMTFAGASCAKGTSVIGGGINPGTKSVATGVEGVEPESGAMFSTGLDYTGTGSVPITSYAICAA
jgi:hypothetical protein